MLQSKEKYKYATSLKLFNYIEAGLPVLVSKDLTYQSWIISRYGAGIVVGKSDMTRMKHVITAQDYSALVAGLLRRREEISLRVHIPRLLTFYRQVAGRRDSIS